MRKLNTILSVLLLFICLLHGLMGSFMLLGIFAKNPFRFCRVSTTLWEAFRWTSGTALRCGICTLPVNAALSTMAQTVWVEILFWVRSMEDRLLRKLPAGKQSVPPICPVPKNPFCPNFPRTLKCR